MGKKKKGIYVFIAIPCLQAGIGKQDGFRESLLVKMKYCANADCRWITFGFKYSNISELDFS